MSSANTHCSRHIYCCSTRVRIDSSEFTRTQWEYPEQNGSMEHKSSHEYHSRGSETRFLRLSSKFVDGENATGYWSWWFHRGYNSSGTAHESIPTRMIIANNKSQSICSYRAPLTFSTKRFVSFVFLYKYIFVYLLELINLRLFAIPTTVNLILNTNLSFRRFATSFLFQALL